MTYRVTFAQSNRVVGHDVDKRSELSYKAHFIEEKIWFNKKKRNEEKKKENNSNKANKNSQKLWGSESTIHAQIL